MRISDWSSDVCSSDLLLIIVNNRKLGEYEPYWHKAVDRFLHDREIKTPVSFIVHSRREVNEAIRKGQYFFTDIRKEGIVLYELDDEPLVEPRPRTAKEAYETAKEPFERSEKRRGGEEGGRTR